MNDTDLIDDLTEAMDGLTCDLRAADDLAARGRAIDRRRTRRRALSAGIPAVAVVGALALVLAGTGAGSGHGAGHATPLVRLAANVRVLPSPAQPGDATLVVRTTSIGGQPSSTIGGYDLYADSGQSYYAFASLSALQQQVDAGDNQAGPVTETQELDALAAAATGSPAEARHTALTVIPVDRRDPPTSTISQDSLVWVVATQALAAGAGRPDVRAGAMQALSTITGLTQTPEELDGVSTLKLTFPMPGGPEVIWLDARTGVPVQETTGSGAGQSVTGFEVERVTAAHLPSQVSPDARLR